MLEELIKSVQAYNENTDVELITKAFNLTKKAHDGQKRNSGEDYFIHPVEVAMILTGLHMDDETICAGLMHDVLEDTEVTEAEMTDEFGEEITLLVDGVTKLKKIKYKTKEENQIESIRKMALAMANDIRVIIIKLADRLHNMRTLEYMTRNKQIAKAEETLEIYVPLAHRLGINTIKWELEDLCLKYLDPISYYDIVDGINQKRSEREQTIDKIIGQIETEVDELDFNYSISGRPKGIYSIYKKMKKQNSTMDEIFDLIAIRVLLDNIKECYAVLGVVHTLWKPIPGRFKDYIAMPKPNLYQSLHTTVIGEKGQIFEVQIRTYDMHQTAEYGIAAHWKYKEGKNKTSNFDQRLTWIRQLMEWEKNTKDSYEFMDIFKGDLFSDEVYIFSPKGDVIDLPKGATPIDFAYRVHTDIGNKCVGAKVNGKLVPLSYRLQTGEIVEILTSKNSTGPGKDWLKMVVSSQAKSKIKQYFKKKQKDENVLVGKESLERELKKKNYELNKILQEDWLMEIAEKNNLLNIESFYASIGYGQINLDNVVNKLENKYKEKYKEEISLEDLVTKEQTNQTNQTNQRSANNNTETVNIDDISNLESKFAKCCNPVPGDKIVGYITMGRGISIHRINCPNIANIKNKERLIQVKWDAAEQSKYTVRVAIIALDNSGYLADLTQLISKEAFNLTGLNTRINKDATYTIELTLEISDTEDLDRLFNKIKDINGTLNIYRLKN